MPSADDARPDPAHAMAEAVRAQLIEAAQSAWEQAGICGLCAEGRYELLLDALRRTRLEPPSAT